MTKRILIFLLASIAPLFLFSQEKEVRSLNDFHGIKMSSSLDAELVKGNTNQAVVKVKGYELDDVITEIRNGILHLGMKSNNWSGGWKKKEAKVIITYTDDIDKIIMAGSTDLISKGTLTGDHLDLEVSGSSDIYLTVDYKSIDARLSGSSDIMIDGDAHFLVVEASGSSDFEGEDLEVDDADLVASGSSDIYIHVNESIKAIARSSSDIEYSGNPKQKNFTEKGSGDISKG